MLGISQAGKERLQSKQQTNKPSRDREMNFLFSVLFVFDTLPHLSHFIQIFIFLATASRLF